MNVTFMNTPYSSPPRCKQNGLRERLSCERCTFFPGGLIHVRRICVYLCVCVMCVCVYVYIHLNRHKHPSARTQACEQTIYTHLGAQRATKLCDDVELARKKFGTCRAQKIRIVFECRLNFGGAEVDMKTSADIDARHLRKVRKKIKCEYILGEMEPRYVPLQAIAPFTFSL